MLYPVNQLPEKDMNIIQVYYATVLRSGNLDDMAEALNCDRKTVDRNIKRIGLSATLLGGRQIKISREEFETAYNETVEVDGNTDDLAKRLNTTTKSVKHNYEKHSFTPLKKQRGGKRVGAGRKARSWDALLEQQMQDNLTNSREVGIFDTPRLTRQALFEYTRSQRRA